MIVDNSAAEDTLVVLVVSILEAVPAVALVDIVPTETAYSHSDPVVALVDSVLMETQG